MKTFSKSLPDGMASYIEREMNMVDYYSFEPVPQELFSKENLPELTLKHGYITFNVHAVKMLDECSHIVILINKEKKLMVIKPCGEDVRDSVQWSRVDNRGKTVPKKLSCKIFTAMLFRDLEHSSNFIFKVNGKLQQYEDEKILVFNLSEIKMPKRGKIMFKKEMQS